MAKNLARTGKRTITWQAPEINEQTATRSGLDLLRAVRDGLTPPPPVWMLIGLRLAEIEEGRAVFEIKFAEYHYSRFAKVQGGIECAVFDAATGYAVHSTLPPGGSYTTLELKVNYLRPITIETGLMRCTGGIIHRGNRIAVAEATMQDTSGRAYGHAVSTCLIM